MDVADQRVVGVHHPLGLTSRPACVHQDSDVVGCGPHFFEARGGIHLPFLLDEASIEGVVTIPANNKNML